MKKKNYLFVAVFSLFAVTSCSKDYTCECTEMDFEDGELVYSDVYSFRIIDASKRQAQFNCMSEEEILSETNGDQFFKYERTCNLK